MGTTVCNSSWDSQRLQHILDSASLLYDDPPMVRPIMADNVNLANVMEWDRLNALALGELKIYLHESIYNIVWKGNNLTGHSSMPSYIAYTVMLISPGTFPRFPPNSPLLKTHFSLNGLRACGRQRTRKQISGGFSSCLGR